MKTNNAPSESLNDLVFENRNKEYGAYIIRKSYNDNLSIALFSSLLLAMGISLICFLFTKTVKELPNVTGQIDTEHLFTIPVNLTPEVKPEIKIEKQNLTKEVIVPKSDNLSLVASDSKKDVIEATNPNSEIVKNGKVDGKDSVPTTPFNETVAPTNNTNSNTIETLAIVTEMPEFNGNLFQFIQNNIQYPHIARDYGTSGIVVLQFVVEKDGSIGSIKALKEVGDGCTEEAIRVVKAMPKWKPGKNHGEPVRVLFNLPVRFTIK
jgi:protein TonB